MLQGDDSGSGAFALFVRPHTGAFRQLVSPPQGIYPFFLKKMLMLMSEAGKGRGGGGGVERLSTAGID